ncbi:MAG: hypothetical protein BWY77_01616 [bacterium ADurb.Bin431]|nr:MAG: hypothetical protein BWY77_01616 [bacterium ADurb.Bin431]
MPPPLLMTVSAAGSPALRRLRPLSVLRPSFSAAPCSTSSISPSASSIPAGAAPRPKPGPALNTSRPCPGMPVYSKRSRPAARSLKPANAGCRTMPSFPSSRAAATAGSIWISVTACVLPTAMTTRAGAACSCRARGRPPRSASLTARSGSASWLKSRRSGRGKNSCSNSAPSMTWMSPISMASALGVWNRTVSGRPNASIRCRQSWSGAAPTWWRCAFSIPRGEAESMAARNSSASIPAANPIGRFPWPASGATCP